MLFNEHPGPGAPIAPPYTGGAPIARADLVADLPPSLPSARARDTDEDSTPDASWLASLQPPSGDDLMQAESDALFGNEHEDLAPPPTTLDQLLFAVDEADTPPTVAEIGGSAFLAFPDPLVEGEIEPAWADDIDTETPVVVEVNEAMVIPSLQEPPQIDEELAHDLHRDLDASIAWGPELAQNNHSSTDCTDDHALPVDIDQDGDADLAEDHLDKDPLGDDPIIETEYGTESSGDDLLAMIALGHHRRSHRSPANSAPENSAPENSAPENSASENSATIDLPDRHHGRNDPPLDSVIDALHVVAVSTSQARDLLPLDAITTPVSDGLVGAVAIARGGSIDFVGESRCERWGITPAMIGCVADSHPRAEGRIDRDVVLVDGSETVVLESRLPIAATALGFLEEFVAVPLPVGSLVLVASSNLVVIQASRSRSAAAVETLLEFAREERSTASTTLELTVMVQSPDRLEVVGDLGSAAGRLGMAAAVERLTGA